MTRGRIGTLSLNSCGSFIRYSPPALTDAFPVPFFGPHDANYLTFHRVRSFRDLNDAK
jgi:hypothetical protein